MKQSKAYLPRYISERHISERRMGTAGECYEYRLKAPAVLIRQCKSRTGVCWQICVQHLDDTLHVPAYVDTLPEAQALARDIIGLLASGVDLHDSTACTWYVCELVRRRQGQN